MKRRTPVAAPRYAHLFWDLDGTLTDSRDGMLRSVAFALERLGVQADAETLERFLGPPLVRSFRGLCGLEGEALSRAVALYRDRYLRVGWLENRLVPGIEDLLRDLAGAGVAMTLVTVKPRPTAERILEHFDLGRYFAAVSAPARYGLAADKADLLAEAMGGGPWSDPGRSAMIGDHEDDMRAARLAGIDGIAVLYGYGNRQALLAARPVAVAGDACALRRLLLPG